MVKNPTTPPQPSRAVALLNKEKEALITEIKAKSQELLRLEEAIDVLLRGRGMPPGGGRKTPSQTNSRPGPIRWKDLSLRVLAQKGRLLRTREVAEALYPKERDVATMSRYTRYIADALAFQLASKDSPVKRWTVKEGKVETHYFGLSEWFSGKEPKPQFKKGIKLP